MSRGTTLQRRLGIGLVGGMLLMWLVGTAVSGYAVRGELDEAFDSAIQETGQRLLSLAMAGLVDKDEPQVALHVAGIGDSQEFLAWVLRDRTGNLLLKSQDADLDVFPPVPEIGFRNVAGYRIYGTSAADGALYIEVAEPLDHREEAAMEATLALLSPLPLLVPLSLLGVWWFVRRNLRPLRALRAEIESRGDGDLRPSAVIGLPAEIFPIAEAVNRLMERLRRSLEAERSFTANSAHELRTPIAGALAQTQRLIAEAPSEDMRARGRQIEKSLRDLAGLSAKLLELARAEAGSFQHDSPHDLLPVLRLLIDEFRKTKDGCIRLISESLSALPARMDVNAFAILMRNLIENAMKHGAPEEPVVVAIDPEGAIHVVNAGPVVTADVLGRLKGPFERGGAAVPGAGLGLAIAEAIAVSAGARIDLLSPAAGRRDGFEAVVAFPPCGPSR